MNKAFIKEDDLLEAQVRFEKELGPGPRYITPEGLEAVLAERKRMVARELRPLERKLVALAGREQPSWAEEQERERLQRQLAEVSGRLRFLSVLLDRLTVVPPRPEEEQAWLGAWITLEDEEGERFTYRLVGPDEVDSRRNWVSVDTPLARSLLGKRPGEVIPVRLPRRELDSFEVVSVTWTAPEESVCGPRGG